MLYLYIILTVSGLSQKAVATAMSLLLFYFSKVPFTLANLAAILAAIFAAIFAAISRRFQIARVNYWRNRGDSLHGRFEIAAKSQQKSPLKLHKKSPVSTGLYGADCNISSHKNVQSKSFQK